MREDAGLSRPELAAMIRSADGKVMAVTTLQTLEEEPQRSSKYLVPLANYFGVSPEWLSTGKGPREAIVKGGLDEHGWASHFGKFDRQSLAYALQWMRWQEDNGLESQPERQVDRLIAIYRRFLADGGREMPDHVMELAAAAKPGGKHDRGTAE